MNLMVSLSVPCVYCRLISKPLKSGNKSDSGQPIGHSKPVGRNAAKCLTLEGSLQKKAFPLKPFDACGISKGMSTATQSQTNIAKLDHELNEAILSGDILNAFEKFYANSIVMQENDSEPFVGKDVNRKREQEFVNSVEQFHGAKLLGEAVNGETSYSEWEYDVTFKGGGGRVKLQQVASRRWKNGQVVHERFYYKTSH